MILTEYEVESNKYLQFKLLSSLCNELFFKSPHHLVKDFYLKKNAKKY